MKEREEPIIVNAQIILEKNPHNLPVGTKVLVKISIIDEYEIIQTSHKEVTKDVARSLKGSKKIKAYYSEEQEKTIIKYPNKTKEEIKEIVEADFKKIMGK